MSAEQIDEALRAVAAARAALARLERSLVVHARTEGRTWSELAGPLGVSKQAMRRRHIDHDPIASGRPRLRPTEEEYRERVLAWARANGHAR